MVFTKLWWVQTRGDIQSGHKSHRLLHNRCCLDKSGRRWCGAVLFCALNLLAPSLAVLAIITMPSGCSHSPDFVLVGGGQELDEEESKLQVASHMLGDFSCVNCAMCQSYANM